MNAVPLHRHGIFGGLRRWKWVLFFLAPICALTAGATVTGTILSFGITNYSAYVIAGDTNSGGRQAIRTSTGMFFTNTSSTSQSYDFQLVYQLVDDTGQPAQILDQDGQTNTAYSVFETETLPYSITIGVPPFRHTITFTSSFLTNEAPLQPVSRLDPYQYYTATLTVYSRPSGTGPYTYTGQSSSDGEFTFYDFTNTISPDPSPNLLVTLPYTSLGRTWAIHDSPGEGAFPVAAEFLVQRYDDFTQPPHPTNTTVTLNYQLINTVTGLPVPLLSTQAVFNISIQSNDGSSPPNPVYVYEYTNFMLVPLAQLDSVDGNYQVVITLTHTEGSTVVRDDTNDIGPQQLLDFNSQLYFGSLLTEFTNLDSGPEITDIVPGDRVDCLIPVTAGAGSIPGAPGHTYGDGSYIAVSLLPDGTAVAQSGVTVTPQGPSPDIASIQNISFERSGLTLTSSGAVCNITVNYPLGFSTAFPVQSVRWSVPAFPLSNVILNQSLDPASNTLTYPFAVYCIQETLPVWFEAPSIQWVVNSGQLVVQPTGAIFVRQLEDDLLTANQAALVNTNTARRVSNDAFYRNVTTQTGSSLVITADANGVAQVSTRLLLGPLELRPHFPYSGNADGAEIQVGDRGLLIFDNGVVDTNSFLPLNAPAPVLYGRDAGDTNCSAVLAGPATLPFTPYDGQLEFTPDGGLLGYGTVPSTNLTWGYIGGGRYAQQAYNIQNSAYVMAGTFLTGGQAAASVDPTELPAVVLFTGWGDASNPAYLERPAGANYPAGLANYSGLNFRGPSTGASYLAGQPTGPYSLYPSVKYYARAGGVSGIHEALTFPPTLHLYGYDFTFTNYLLSFLDSDVDESRTDGAISFPAQPAGFIQEFERMIFSSRGDLESATLPPSSGVKHLSYWDVNFTPESIGFHPSTNDTCGTGQRWLVLGAETTLPFIPQKLHASLGFQATGNLVTAADGVAGCDSRFQVPAQLSLQGPGGDVYPLSTCSDGYFNNWATAGAPPSGFYNLAGRLRVPFFEDIKVHLHIMPTGTTTAQISIMGGWPDADSQAQDLGWSVNTSNYFNTAVFDPSAAGFPASQGVTIANYETSPNTQYRARAQREWIDVATFDYPLQWNPALRQFASFQDSPVDLPIIDVNSRLLEISPGKVNFDFDQDVSLQLPCIKALDFINNAVNEIDGPLTSVSNAVRSAINAAFDTAGFNELQHTLCEDPTAFFQPVLTSALTPAVNQLYTQLSSFPQANSAAFLSNVVYQVNSGPLTTALQNINGAAGQASTVIGQVDKTMTDAQNDLGVLLKILAKDSNGDRHVVSAIIQQLTSDEGPALGFITSLAGGEVDSLVTNLDPTLDDIQSQLQDLSNQVAQVHSSLTSASGDFNKALAQALSDSTGASQFVQAAALNLSNRLSTVLTPAGDFFSSDPASAKQAIQQELTSAFLNSQLPADFQQTLKQYLFDDNSAVDLLLDTLFDQINDAIRDGLSDLITDSDDSTLQAVKGLASGSFLSAKIRGTPTFSGDSLRKIHLNAAVQVNVPDAMNFTAYMEILELNSQSVPVDCIPAGAPAAEVTIGANNVKLDWPGFNPTGTPLTLSVAAKWTLQSGNVIGLGGDFDIKGEVGFDGCSVNEIGAALAFGEEENYFAAKVAGTVNILGVPVNVQAGVFVGKACSIQPILFIDPEATNVLSLPLNEFGGIYLEFGAGLSLSQILFGESDCFLDLGVNVSYAVYYDQTSSIEQIGTRQTFGIDASLLCLISGNVSLTMFGTATHSPSGFDLEVGGDAQLCGSIGPCPFCITGCKDITVTGDVGTGGIAYHVDF